MARKSYTAPASAQLSIEQMQSALPRLEKRLADLKAFDPTQISDRDAPEIRTLGDAVDDFLTRTFGKESAEYVRYSSARLIDTGLHFVGGETPQHEIISGLERGKARAIGILNDIKRLFLEEIELSSGNKDAPIAVAADGSLSTDTREIFVVHGTDHGTKSRFRKSCGSGQSADEEHDGGGVEEGAGRGDGGLEVLCQSPVAVDPGEEALHDPAARLDGEADLIGAFAHDLDGDHGGRGDLLAGVAAIGKDLLDERKRAA